ncbi:MAG: putative toxin-antitoxin system toxin component, PIN family [Chloroflexi bacterium]|nr:putative toxin-antitoxin system toxin component, PIN family [Chloroflexota bacterium]
MNVVLDTNILVSALISSFGNPARILDLVLLGDLRHVYDDRILAEYREVLVRPRFGFDADNVADILYFLEIEGVAVTAPPLPNILPDRDDLPFLEVAAAMGATLITGNAKHFPAEQVGQVHIQTPADFLAWWRQRTS